MRFHDRLFHFQTTPANVTYDEFNCAQYSVPADDFSLSTLTVFFLIYFILACWTYGLAVPSGLFVPSLLAGAAYGRGVGLLLQQHNLLCKPIDAGIYSLIGASAVLGGMARMTISLTVILLEATGNVKYGLPLMLTLMSAKLAGDKWNEGLYEEHIHLNHVPFLAPHLEPREFVSKLRVSDVMTRAPVSLRRFATAGEVYRTLLATTHHCFPVVRDTTTTTTTTAPDSSQEEEAASGNGHGDAVIGGGALRHRGVPAAARASLGGRDLRGPRFLGVVLRKHLTVLLHHKDFATRPEDFASLPWHPLGFRDLEGGYPRYPRIADLYLDRRELAMHLDLRSYCNPCPTLVVANTPLTTAYKMFRSLGLRHLPVTNHRGELVGILTRHELTSLRMKQMQDRATESTQRRMASRRGGSSINS